MTCRDDDDDNDKDSVCEVIRTLHFDVGNEQDDDIVWDVLIKLAMMVIMMLTIKVMMRTTKIVFGVYWGLRR